MPGFKRAASARRGIPTIRRYLPLAERLPPRKQRFDPENQPLQFLRSVWIVENGKKLGVADALDELP
jgi:hypothetical protein